MPATPPDGGAEREPAALAAAVLAVLWMTTIIVADGGRTVVTAAGRVPADFQLRWIAVLSDAALAAVGLLGLARLSQAVRAPRRHLCGLGAAALWASLLPAFLAHPSDRGVAAMLRLAGATGLALLLPSLTKAGRRVVASAAVVTVVVELVVAVLERASSAPLGLGSLGEPAAYTIGGAYAPTGLTVHPYVLAAFGAAAAGAAIAAAIRRRTPAAGGAPALSPAVLVTAAAGAALVGLTLSRGALVALALVLGVGAAAAATRRLPARVPAAAAIGGAIGVAAQLSGWRGRVDEAGTAGVGSGRGTLVRQAWGLLRADWLLGTGPGRYVLALSDRADLVALSAQSPRPVHIVPLLLVAEGGVIGGLGVAALSAAIAVQAVRGRWSGIALVAGAAPILLLDHLYWSYPQGIVLLGAWLGALDAFTDPDP